MSTKDEDNRAEAARLLGMKRSEIIEVKPADDGVLVKTHDGNWTLIREDGEMVHRVDPPVDADDAIREDVEDVVDLAETITENAAPQKSAPKGRSRA